jgi:serine O-acetyltransferase
MTESRHDEITEKLLASYNDVGGINRVDCSNLPSKAVIGDLCLDLLRLLFPGFLDERAIAQGDLAQLTRQSVSSITERLAREVSRSLRFRNNGTDVSPEEVAGLCCDFIDQLPEIRRMLATDVEAAYEGDPAARSNEEIILSYPAIEAIAIFRSANLLYQADLPLIPRIMTEWAHSRTGIDIHPGATIGEYFFIDHGTGVVIGETCSIGNRVKLYHGVTLGARSFEKDEEGKIVKGIKRHPDVEDDVTIYPNATVLGGTTVIGARSTVGGNAFILQSIPPDSLVAYEEGGIKILDKLGFKNGEA